MGLARGAEMTIPTSEDGSIWATRTVFPAAELGLVSPSLRSRRVEVGCNDVGVLSTQSAGGFFLFFASATSYPQIQHAGIILFDAGAYQALERMYTKA